MFNTTNFYNELVTGRGGVIASIGATMNIALMLFESKLEKGVSTLKTKGFIDNAEQNDSCINWIKTDGLTFINDGYKKSANSKKNLFNTYEDFKKNDEIMLRVLRDSLPIAMFLIDSNSPLKVDDSYCTKPTGNKPAKLMLNPKAFNKVAGMNEQFNKGGNPLMIDASFSDLSKMAQYWFFKVDEKPSVKTSVEAKNDKFLSSLHKNQTDEGKLKYDDNKVDSTLKSSLKSIKEILTLFDNHNRADLILDTIEHIKTLDWFYNKHSVSQSTKFIGAVSFDYKLNSIIATDKDKFLKVVRK